MAGRSGRAAPQEIPESVAQDQLDSALSAEIEVPSVSRMSGREEVGGLGVALVLFGAAAFLLARARRRRSASLRAPMAPERGPADIAEGDDRSAAAEAPPAQSIPLPPHVVATLERLARERQAQAEGGEGPEGPGQGQRGFEAWVGR